MAASNIVVNVNHGGDPVSADALARKILAGIAPAAPADPDYSQRFGLLVASDRMPIRDDVEPRIKDKQAVIRLYDPINSYGGSWGISAKEVAATLDDLPDTVEEIHLLINSPGGEVTEGMAIVGVLRKHPARVVAVVEGVAASTASFIACAADEMIMARNAELFIHEPWGLVVGNAADHRKNADDLDHFADNIASVYADKAGGTAETWRAAMAAETWYSAEQAVEAGLADSVDAQTEPAKADKAKARFDLTVFNISGRQQAPGEQHPATVPVTGSTPEQEGTAVDFTPEQITNLRQCLNLAEDADETAIRDALIDTVTTEDEPPAPLTLPEGVVAVDAAQLEQLRADASAGRDARSQQLADQRNQIVDAAVSDGRIPPARKQHWLDLLAADPGAEQVLASLAKGTIPVAVIGNGGSIDLDSDEALYAELFGKEVTA